MSKPQSLQYNVLNDQLSKNQNPLGYKICIKQLMKGVQDRTYWYFTVQQAQFLSNVYKKQVQQQQLRNRLKQITDQAINQVFDDILTGKLNKIAVSQKGLIATVKILQKVQQLAQAGHNYYSIDNPVVKQTQQKIKQINQDYKKFKQRVQHMKQKELQKKLQKQSIQRQIKQKIQQQKKLQYHKSVMKRLQIMKLKQEQRMEQNQKYKMFMKQFKKIKPLHQLMQQQFKQRIQLPQLQQSRKRLQLYKSKKKPTLQQINDHQRQYIYTKQSKPQRTFIQHHTIDVGYKSHFYKEIQQNQKEKGQDQYTSMLWDQVQKKKRYSMMVKENHKPKISKKLHESIEISRAQTSTKKIIPDNSRVRELGKFYLEYVKSLQKNHSSSQQQKQQDSQQNHKVYSSRYTNYLQDLKKGHQNKLKGFGTDWQVDLNDRTASKSQKRDRILIKSKQLQQKVQRQQMFIKNHNYGKAQDIIDKKKQIDQTLLEAIKAKMALLKDVKGN